MGRAKRDIKTIEDLNNRRITYARRRAGLFKKAYELSILTASEVLVITRHPSNSKLSHFSHPRRAEDMLIRFLIMSDDHDKKVKDGNGQQTSGRIVIRNKDRLIAQLQELKIQDDMYRATAEEISIEQGISGPIRSGDDNQSIQHFKVINPQDFHQHVLDLQRFYNTGTPTPSEQLFRDYDEKLKAMLSYIQERKMLLQQQQQSQVIQTNAVFANMKLQQIEENSMHGQQGFTLPQQGYNMQLQPDAHNIKFEQQWEPQGHNIQFQQVPLPHQWSSPYLNTEGSLKAPLQTTPVTQQQEERINSLDNGHINAIGDQYLNEIELATLMSSPNNRWCSTYDTDGPSHYIHQSIGDDAKNGSILPQQGYNMQLQPEVHNINFEQQWEPQGHNIQFQQVPLPHQWSSPYLNAEGSLQAPLQTTPVTQQQEERINSIDNGHISAIGDQYFHEIKLATLMSSPNNRRCSTYDTDGPSHYTHQSFGDDANNGPDFGSNNDELNFDEHYFDDLNLDELNFDDLNSDELNFDDLDFDEHYFDDLNFDDLNFD